MISILIPTYNRANLIIETLVSIQNQTYNNWECIIVDDGSTDDSEKVIFEFINSDSRFKFYKRPLTLKKGPSSCRNFAFEQSKGHYIQFFDSDDIMHPDHLKLKIETIGKSDFVVCKLLEFKSPFHNYLFLSENDFEIKKVNNVFESFVLGDFPLMMVAPMWKKETLKFHMPIREDLHLLEDHEFHARILLKTKNYEIINKSLIYYRVGSTSTTNNFYNNISTGIDSYIKAKKSVLSITNSQKVKVAILKMTLGFMRMGLAQKQYKSAEKCFKFIREEKIAFSLELKLKTARIYIFYLIFKTIKVGDTRYKFLLKL